MELSRKGLKEQRRREASEGRESYASKTEEGTGQRLRKKSEDKIAESGGRAATTKIKTEGSRYARETKEPERRETKAAEKRERETQRKRGKRKCRKRERTLRERITRGKS